MRTKEQEQQVEKLRQNFVPMAVGIIILIISLTVVRPIALNVFRLREENKKLQKRLLSLKTKLADLKTVDEFQVSQRVKTVERVFPSERPIVDLLFVLAKLAEETEVGFGGIDMKPGKIVRKAESEGAKKTTPAKSKLGSALQDFEISFEIKGKFADISQFISRLEKIAPLMRVEDMVLSFSPIKEEEEEKKEEEIIPESKVKLTVKVFYQSLPETLGAVDKPLPKFTSSQEEILVELSEFEAFEFEVVPVRYVGEERNNPFEL